VCVVKEREDERRYEKHRVRSEQRLEERRVRGLSRDDRDDVTEEERGGGGVAERNDVVKTAARDHVPDERVRRDGERRDQPHVRPRRRVRVPDPRNEHDLRQHGATDQQRPAAQVQSGDADRQIEQRQHGQERPRRKRKRA
jgi:hypothetical protein